MQNFKVLTGQLYKPNEAAHLALLRGLCWGRGSSAGGWSSQLALVLCWWDILHRDSMWCNMVDLTWCGNIHQVIGLHLNLISRW